MSLKWYYTEGQLTLKVDSEEHKFSLEDLIASSTVYKERRKKIQRKSKIYVNAEYRVDYGTIRAYRFFAENEIGEADSHQRNS